MLLHRIWDLRLDIQQMGLDLGTRYLELKIYLMGLGTQYSGLHIQSSIFGIGTQKVGRLAAAYCRRGVTNVCWIS